MKTYTGLKINERYQIQELISSNEYGQVFKGVDELTNKKISIKLLKIPLEENDKQFVEEIFYRECNSLERVSDKNVINYIDSGVFKDHLFIITDFFENSKTLFDVINGETKYTFEWKYEVIKSILLGLSACHKESILHRDLKPTNILISSDRDVKIIDFGTSKIKGLYSARTGVTLREYYSTRYASPEQLQWKSLDERSDIFSCGCIIFFILSGEEPPINKEDLKELVNELSIPDSIKDILEKMVSLNCDDRIRTVDNLIRQLEDAKRELDVDGNKLNIVYKKRVMRQLENLSKIEKANETLSSYFISNSLKKCNIYKKANDEIILVGDRVKYSCEIDLDNSQFIISKAFGVPVDKLEFERKKGSELSLSLTAQLESRFSIVETDDLLIEYIEELLEKDKENQINKKKEKNLTELLQNWDDYLKKKKEKDYTQRNIGKYKKIEYDPVSDYVYLELNKHINFEKGNLIQVNQRNGKSIVIGEFYDYMEEKKIIITPVEGFDEDRLQKKGTVGINNQKEMANINRFSKVIYNLENENTVNKSLSVFLAKPDKLILNRPIKKVNKIINENFLSDNIEVVEKALSTNSLFLIQGPPGTGKTTLISEIVGQIHLENPEAKVLFVSPSHVAVDHALKSIQTTLENIGVGSSAVLRVGMEERVSDDIKNLMIEHHVKRWSSQVKRQSMKYFEKYLSEKYPKLSNNSEEKILEILKNDEYGDRKLIENELKNLPIELKKIIYILKNWYRKLYLSEDIEMPVVKDTFIVGSTCTGIATKNIFEAMVFDWVIIDEAARATAPELLLPLTRGKKSIMVGDHMQLPPIVSSDNDELDKRTKNILEKSLFEDLFNGASGTVKVTLSTQFRMHPAISRLVNLNFYDTEVKDYFGNKKYVLEKYFKPIIWIDTSSESKKYQSPKWTSFRNFLEVDVIIEKLKRLNDIGKIENRVFTVGIISGYEAQKQLLEEKAAHVKHKLKFLKIEIDNTDAFQGSEKDIIFYSVVRSNRERKLGFLKDERRLNVSLSRAKEQLFIVGDMDVSNYETGDADHVNPFKSVVNHILANRNYCSVE